MKKLIDDTEVNSRGYYYLLDWNEQDNWNTILILFNTAKLHELTISQYKELFKIATESDYNVLDK